MKARANIINQFKAVPAPITREIGLVLLLSLAAWLSIAFLFIVLDFNILWQTDSQAYYYTSQNLSAYRALELPAYPVTVYLFSLFLPGTSPEFYMQFVSLLAYLVSIIGVYIILLELDIPLAWRGALIFALFPLEGVTFSVYPRVNAFFYFWLIASLAFYIKGYRWATILCLAITLFTHKSAWPFVVIIAMIGAYKNLWRWWMIALIPLPLGVYWLAGAQAHHDLFWLFNSSVSIKFTSENSLPILSGIITTWRSGLAGNVPDLLQALILSGQLIIAIYLLYSRIWVTNEWMLGIIIPIILWSLLLNAKEIWSAYSYSHLILLPLLAWLNSKWDKAFAKRWFTPTVIILMVSQIIWAFYAVHYHT